MHVLLLMQRIENNPDYIQRLVKAYDVGDETPIYKPKMIGLRDGEIVELTKCTRETDVEISYLKEEAWETMNLMEEAGDLVDIIDIDITG